MPQQSQRLTRDQVIDIVGRLDDMRLAGIVASGATAAELTEAYTRTTSDIYLGRPISVTVAKLVDLLKADDGLAWDDR